MMFLISTMPDPTVIYTALASKFSGALGWVIGAVGVLYVVDYILQALKAADKRASSAEKRERREWFAYRDHYNDTGGSSWPFLDDDEFE